MTDHCHQSYVVIYLETLMSPGGCDMYYGAQLSIYWPCRSSVSDTTYYIHATVRADDDTDDQA